VVVCRVANDHIEVHCHGGRAVCEAILDSLIAAGCHRVKPVEWPSQWSCPISRDAELDLLSATTDRTAAILVDQLQGALLDKVCAVIDCLQRSELLVAIKDLKELLRWSDLGAHLIRPWRVVMAGPPNVGKSSLTNALIGQEQVIVHHEAGTTRDWIECQLAIDGWPVAITDTAGIREAETEVESQGVTRGLAQLQTADLVVLVVDRCFGWTETHRDLLRSVRCPAIIAWNKSDLATSEGLGDHRVDTAGVLEMETSAVGPPGCAGLLSMISSQLVPDWPPPGAAVPFRQEQRSAIECALASLELVLDVQHDDCEDDGVGRAVNSASKSLQAIVPSWSREAQGT
jgi:tRNA modification GTPase